MQPQSSVPPGVLAACAPLHKTAFGIAVGLVAGLAVVAATLFLVARGGENVGAHLGLLRAYFPGYSVSVTGGLIGFAYAFVVGYVAGRLVGAIYNRVTDALG